MLHLTSEAARTVTATAPPPSPLPYEETDIRTRSHFYLPELDTLRFAAFLCVFCLHLFPGDESFFQKYIPLPSLAAAFFRAGGYGVDLFFVLSAYLITELLLRERAKAGAVHVRKFYLRRILRIWPLYFFFVGFAWIFGELVPSAHVQGRLILAYLLLAGNFGLIVWHETHPVIAPLWSVSLEEQFYLLWPPVLRNSTPKKLLRCAFGMIAVSSLGRFIIGYHGYFGDALGMNTLTRLEPIAGGIILAVLLRGRVPRLSSASRIMLFVFGAACWLAVAALCKMHTEAETLPRAMIGYPVVAIGCVAFVLAALGAGTSWPRLMLNPTLVYLGKISYGLYVYHQLAIFLGYLLLHAGPASVSRIAYIPMTLLFTVAAAAASYRWLESPFLRLKDRYSYVASRPV
jgi:peptidoglycan/LPS O-acetylase OafA/YrhL